MVRNFCLAAGVVMGLFGGMLSQPVAAEQVRVYLGCYTKTGAEGIYVLELDTDTGKITQPRLAAKLVNPSFVALHPTEPLLYAVNEVHETDSKSSSANGVTALRIDPESGLLTRLNSQLSGGPGTCHVAIDPAGKTVVVANYSGGSSASFPINPDGSLGPIATFVQHKDDEGKVTKPARGHAANVSADNRFVVVNDLGLDRLFVNRLDPETGKMTPNDPPYVKNKTGAGPRHFSFHPNDKFAYSNGELDSTVTAYAWDAEKGVLKPLMTLSTLPEGFKGKNSTAEILVHPSGKFVYVSNRGDDSIAIFDVQTDGTLKAAGHAKSGGKTPRNFGIDPTGKWMLIANQDTPEGNVGVFKIDLETGGLTPTGQTITVPMACCVRYRPME